MTDLPNPLTPSDCDLRDFPFMPLECSRLRRSKAWLTAKREPELGFYMINLWTACWHDVPAASLEDDDDLLADLAMCDPKRWPKVREKALRGFVKCSDGRLYHVVVAEKAADSWARKQAQRQRTGAAREARAQRRLNGPTEPVTSYVTKAVTEDVTDDATDTVTTSVTDNATDNVTASKREGEGQKKERKKEASELKLGVETTRFRNENGLAEPENLWQRFPTAGPAEPPPDARTALFREGLQRLMRLTGKPESKSRPLLGSFVRDAGDDCALVALVLAEAESVRPADPIPWLKSAISARSGRHSGNQTPPMIGAL